MLVLGIETATDVCSVGLVDGEHDLASFSLLRPRQHGTRLAGLIQSVLASSGAAPEALSGIAVSAGPGSYTGLRIGLSTAKGLCLASGASLLAVPTLRALASGVRSHAGRSTIVAVLPSRRGEMYAAAYRMQGDTLSEVRPPTALSLDHDSIDAWMPASPHGLRVTGPASGALLEWVEGTASPLDGAASGLEVARLGRQRLVAGEVEDLAAYEPDYLKPFVSGDPAARARG